jgi:hypothetical protein
MDAGRRAFVTTEELGALLAGPRRTGQPRTTVGAELARLGLDGVVVHRGAKRSPASDLWAGSATRMRQSVADALRGAADAIAPQRSHGRGGKSAPVPPAAPATPGFLTPGGAVLTRHTL